MNKWMDKREHTSFVCLPSIHLFIHSSVRPFVRKERVSVGKGGGQKGWGVIGGMKEQWEDEEEE